MNDHSESSDIVWWPTQEMLQASNLAAFMQTLGIVDKDPAGYRQLLMLADKDPHRFWESVIRYAGLKFYRPYEAVFDSAQGIEWTQWCVGGTTNAILNCLDRHESPGEEAKTAIVWEGEDGRCRTWRYTELKAETSRLASGLRSLGCKPGDVIGVLMPMVPEAAAAMLAVVKIGAVVLPLFSGFGSAAVIDRLNDAHAVAVITADGTWRRGKRYDLKATLDQALPRVPTLRHIVVLRNTGEVSSWDPNTDHWWGELCCGKPTNEPTEQMSAEAPMMLIYTSGTTGRPKGTVHSHCGFITKMALDLGLCADYKSSDRMLWMSDMGWLAGPILIYATTLVGATMVIAEGAHDYPDPDRFWRLIQQHRVSMLGIAPTIVRGFMQVGGANVDKYDLSSLRVTLSTGEAWTHDAWMWMFEKVCRRRAPIINYSGGTEVGGGIVTGTVLHPMKPCAFSGPVPGMGADVMDELGRSVGRVGIGELVLRRPSIGLTRGLWRDADRYLESYWRKSPGVWWHGDRARIDEGGFWYILGRSDDTLKIAGKRTGPAEIETLVLGTGRIAEVAAIGVPDRIKGQSLVLVVVLMPGSPPGPEVEEALRMAVVAGLGAAFRPSSIAFVPELPKTRNLKIMRRVVRAVYLGEAPGDLSSLVNPEVVSQLGVLLRRPAEVGPSHPRIVNR